MQSKAPLKGVGITSLLSYTNTLCKWASHNLFSISSSKVYHLDAITSASQFTYFSTVMQKMWMNVSYREYVNSILTAIFSFSVKIIFTKPVQLPYSTTVNILTVHQNKFNLEVKENYYCKVCCILSYSLWHLLKPLFSCIKL